MFAVPAGSPGSQLVPGNHQAQSNQGFRVCSRIGSLSPPLPTSADSSARGGGRGCGRDTPGTKGTNKKGTTKPSIGAGYSGSRGRREPMGNQWNATPEKAKQCQVLRGPCQHPSARPCQLLPTSNATRCNTLPLGPSHVAGVSAGIARARGVSERYARTRDAGFRRIPRVRARTPRFLTSFRGQYAHTREAIPSFPAARRRYFPVMPNPSFPDPWRMHRPPNRKLLHALATLMHLCPPALPPR